VATAITSVVIVVRIVVVGCELDFYLSNFPPYSIVRIWGFTFILISRSFYFLQYFKEK
jgi:hypothetical protein